jgi:MbtH protein
MAAAKGRIHSAGDDDENEKDQLYNVVMDIEDRYSIWPARLPIPQYWRAEGFSGRKKECLDYIQNVWTDMRPKSLKEDMAKWEAEYEKRKPSPETLKKLEEERIRSMEEGIDHFHSMHMSSTCKLTLFIEAQPPNDLVKKLMRRPVEIIRYRDRETGAPDPKKLSAAINRAYVLVKFPHTQGGTELGASLDTTGTLNYLSIYYGH